MSEPTAPTPTLADQIRDWLEHGEATATDQQIRDALHAVLHLHAPETVDGTQVCACCDHDGEYVPYPCSTAAAAAVAGGALGVSPTPAGGEQ